MPRNRSDAAPESSAGKRAAGRDGAGLTDAEVAAYLRQHPDFLERNGDLIEILTPPSPNAEPAVRGRGAVVDLQNYMLGRLRKELDGLRGKIDDMVANSRANLNHQIRIHQAVLALVAAGSFEHLIETVTTDLAIILDLDVVTLCVEPAEGSLPPRRISGLQQLAPGTIEALLGGKRAALLRPEIAGDPEIFGAAAGLVRSDALIRLDIAEAAPPTLIAFGSRQPDHFHPGQGTELLNFLARVLEITIRAWLALPA